MSERLRDDGLYRHMGSDGHCRWYRFYESGEVLSASTSPGPARQVAGWLRREGRPEHTPMGEYQRDGDRLRFVLRWRLPSPPTAASQSSEHEAFLEAGRLRDTFHAARTGEPMEVTYDFLVLDGGTLDGDPGRRKHRRITSWKKLADTGIDAQWIAHLKKSEAVTLGVVNSATRDDLVERAGLPGAIAEAILAWRDGG